MTVQKFTATISGSQRLTESTLLITLKLPKDISFNFKAGQFMLIYQNIEGKEENRAFSICSKPSQDTLEFLIRKYEKGKISPKLFGLEQGDQLKIHGPFGIFNIRETKNKETIFIASGTGIAPLRSMTHEILENNPNKNVTLVFGFRTMKDFFFKEELTTLKDKYPNFNIYPCSTQPEESWQHFKGRVTSFLPQLIKNPEDKDAYICGPNKMINDTLKVLIKDLNFKQEQTHIERWGTS